MRKPLIYLDHACTSHPKSPLIWKAVKYYLEKIGTSPGRSGSTLARIADNLLWETRELLAKLFNVKYPQNIFFSHNATHASNIILKGFLKPNDHVIYTSLEHNSILRPLQQLKQKRQIHCTEIKPSPSGELNLSDFEKNILSNTRLIVLTHISNAIGSIAPIKEIGVMAKEHGIDFMVDTAQSAGVLDIDVQQNNITFLTFTGHKYLGGPSGIGGGYIEDPASVDSLYEGGTGFNSLQLLQPETSPIKFEAGTENYLGVAGLNAALKVLSPQTIKNHKSKIEELTLYCKKELSNLQEIILYGPQKDKNHLGIISFNVKEFMPVEVSSFLDQNHNIMTRAGILCAPLIHYALETAPNGIVRVSFGHDNTKEEIDSLIIALKELISKK